MITIEFFFFFNRKLKSLESTFLGTLINNFLLNFFDVISYNCMVNNSFHIHYKLLKLAIFPFSSFAVLTWVTKSFRCLWLDLHIDLNLFGLITCNC